MNERILELEDQCWVKVPCDFDMKAGGASTIWTVFDRKKFAELIAKECMDIILDESEKVSDEWRCKDGKHIWWKIKEHFGVE